VADNNKKIVTDNNKNIVTDNNYYCGGQQQ
jgi:hypothetical protein